MKLKEYITLINLFKFILVFFTLCKVGGCSRYIKFLEKNNQRDFEIKRPTVGPRLCQRPKLNIIHDSNFTIKEFSKINNKDLSTVEKGLLLILYQMVVRPDATDWSSRIQIHLKQGSKEYHRDFGNFVDLPLLAAINDLKNQGFLKGSPKRILSRLQRRLPKRVTMQESFHKFLKNFPQDSKVQSFYFKLDNPLQKGESFERRSISIPAVTKFKKLKKVGLFKVDQNYHCSFDSQLYKKGIFLISKKPFQENAFGLVEESSDYFFAVTKKNVENKEYYKGQQIPGGAPSSLSPFCIHKNPKRELLLLGLKSRDPGQLLYHLYNYRVHDAQSPQETINFLNFPRHQFLTRPSRLLYESEKGSEEQLRYFLSLDFPVYHIDNLGLVHAIWTEGESSVFISDQREEVHQSCIP